MVPSATGSTKYEVDLKTEWCSCPDHELRGRKCKHIFAVETWVERQKNSDGSETVTEARTITETVTRKTYPQDWPNYNAAQTNEKRHFRKLLYELCQSVPEFGKGKGRPRIPTCDALFSMIYKVYSTLSGRRFMTDLDHARELGFIDKTPHYNSVFNYFEMEQVTPILYSLIQLASRPLSGIEEHFSIDSSGFSTSRFVRWLDHKYGQRKKHDWIKIHIMCGTNTHVVTAVEIADRNTHDITQAPALLDTTSDYFTMAEVSADKAYLSRKLVGTISGYGAKPLIPMKSDSVVHRKDPKTWKKLFGLFHYERDRFLEQYSKRSNCETVFHMVKSKFGDSLRSKTDTAMINEALAKFMAHNICVCIQSAYELGIDPEFSADADQP